MKLTKALLPFSVLVATVASGRVMLTSIEPIGPKFDARCRAATSTRAECVHRADVHQLKVNNVKRNIESTVGSTVVKESVTYNLTLGTSYSSTCTSEIAEATKLPVTPRLGFPAWVMDPLTPPYPTVTRSRLSNATIPTIGNDDMLTSTKANVTSSNTFNKSATVTATISPTTKPNGSGHNNVKELILPLIVATILFYAAL
ncbi:predicted protein [Uncinocarpus reesii 1704]|uniref:Uncharacterized protein n=1 Tax=Uncinocarpus reesii (strain UAMH 1704) TaxID=336963 RepID=C4JL29_UNCRE|nr:uncharacterized protein UREG_00244 [Uncinocarpus reesii 1704]EEP75398.1 predicted protein [Uncinocarpus reesii 1704]